MAHAGKWLATVAIGATVAIPVGLGSSMWQPQIGQVGLWHLKEPVAIAQTQPNFSVGGQVVVKLEDGYYLATVDKVYQDNGFTMVDFSWQVEGGEGSGTYPAETPNFWFTVEEARRQGFAIANAPAGSSTPVTATAPTPNNPVRTTQPTPVAAAPVAAASSSSSTCAGASQLTSAEIQEILRIHNQARAEVGVPLLTWNCKLAEFSQNWVNQDTEFNHSSSNARRQIIPGVYAGENLAAQAPASDPIATLGPKGWWNEKAFWNNATGQCQPGKVCGHYTQMVWRNTTEIGCGVNRQSSVLGAGWEGNSAYLACTYSPGGNYSGQKPY